MFAMEIPYVPVQETPVTMVETVSSNGINEVVLDQLILAGSVIKPDYIFSECYQIGQTEPSDSATHSIDPAAGPQNLLKWTDAQVESASKSMKLLKGPEHGKLSTEIANNGYKFYAYYPTPGYVGNDQVVLHVELDGRHYNLLVTLMVVEVYDHQVSPCSMPDIQYGTGWNQTSSQWNVTNIVLAIKALAGGALGQTTGTYITLDDNAAGHNWYIDTTPGTNEEFLPTSNPYEWIAKEGSAAYGKMDMLSVLFTNTAMPWALGIEHSSDGHDYMATTRTAGVRRLPSAEEHRPDAATCG